jgi:hypothetical protein
VPSYVRTELKKKTGIVINEYGQKMDETEDDDSNKIMNEPKDPNDFMLNLKTGDPNQKGKPSKKEYTPIKSYKPSGNLVYDEELLNRIEGKFG